MAKNRSAESSPMTTLHKTSSAKQLFSASSQSSPANSYNKYTNVATKGPVANFQKSVSSPTGTIQKSFCSPGTDTCLKSSLVQMTNSLQSELNFTIVYYSALTAWKRHFQPIVSLEM